MTPEQFVFWLSGFFSRGTPDCGLVPADVEKIINILKSVENDSISKVMFFETQ